MLMPKRIFSAVIATIVLANSAYAIQFEKPITASLEINPANNVTAYNSYPKTIKLMNVKLNTSSLLNHQTLISLAVNKAETKLASSINLGMNGVPVLDQGEHGTCVTFASTAAIDALIGKGDYVSQLCSLELGNYLEQEGYFASGWDGSSGPWILDQILRFGIVNKKNQKSLVCAGVKEYPVKDESATGNIMSLENYQKVSEDVNENFYPVSILNWQDRNNHDFKDTDDSTRALQQIKKTLSQGDRVTIGVILVLAKNCNVGACATYHARHDTWVVSSEIENPLNSTGGHEMVVTGYDDNAVAIDNNGISHRGLLTLRNSWGENVGDHGNFYMSYDYFVKYAGEAQEIIAQRN
jgi:C1A family cysteine protease